MNVREQETLVADLCVGMYVCRLDRPWEGTPFPVQGVEIRSAADVDAIAGYARSVFIDLEYIPRDDRTAWTVRPAPVAHARDVAAAGDFPFPRRHYVDSVVLEEELPRAREAHVAVTAIATRILDEVRNGRPVAPQEVRAAVEPMVHSILRNTDAFFWIESLRKRDGYDYSHALNCSALAAAFGRHLGFPEDILLDLASGGLLMDVGKLHLPAKLVAREAVLTDDEFLEVQRHVGFGLAAVGGAGTLPERIQEMIRTHHERHDGSGYPAGLSGAHIPLLGRMAGLVDSFDAMTSDRSHRRAMSRHAALQELYRQRDILYAAEVVEQFMQCLGVYPTGSLVELSNGQVAVVMAQNPARRLRPRVMVLTSPDKEPSEPRSLDLMAGDPDGDAAAMRELMIISALEPGAYGLDPAELFL